MVIYAEGKAINQSVYMRIKKAGYEVFGYDPNPGIEPLFTAIFL